MADSLIPVFHLNHVFRFRLGADGKLRLRNIYRKWERVKDSDYCTDGIIGYSNEEVPRPFNNTLDETFIFICAAEPEPVSYFDLIITIRVN